ncbi:hypothetical protein CEXT_69351 [Caerostris extrusa]|uniref:Reverse transcriptase domain-containing protein n=1 Tax=Caerostris extrusa TaxID=172846 RepID=A0AAV4P4W1_CAEEX|nr:hypothetical protein CEXT_69351 [Caerostris extrusa]
MAEFEIPTKFMNLTRVTFDKVRRRFKITFYNKKRSTSRRFPGLLTNLVLEKYIRSLQILAYADDIDIIGKSEKAAIEAF